MSAAEPRDTVSQDGGGSADNLELGSDALCQEVQDKDETITGQRKKYLASSNFRGVVLKYQSAEEETRSRASATAQLLTICLLFEEKITSPLGCLLWQMHAFMATC